MEDVVDCSHGILLCPGSKVLEADSESSGSGEYREVMYPRALGVAD